MSLALLLLAFDSGAMLLHPEAFPSPQHTVDAVSAGAPASEASGSAGDAAGALVYQNGDLMLDLTAEAEPAQKPAGQPLPEPLSLSLLGMGLAVLGWTRRRGKLLGRLKLALRQHLFPWPALSWLD